MRLKASLAVVSVVILSLVACSSTSSWKANWGSETLVASSATPEAPASEKPPSGGGAKRDLNTESQNPVASLISLPFQNNTNFDVGPNDKTTNVCNVQPVLPLSLGDDLKLIVRDVMPVIYLPDDLYPDFDGQFGLGDSVVSFFFGPKKLTPFLGGKLSWGVGPVVNVPTATDDSLGAGDWGMGATGVAFAMLPPVTAGLMVNNITTFEDKSVNHLTIQPIFYYNLGDGWSVGTVPLITANWNAPGPDQWTVPVGAGCTKLIRFGKQPVKFGLFGYGYAAKPDHAADWTLQLTVTFLFPE